LSYVRREKKKGIDRSCLHAHKGGREEKAVRRKKKKGGDVDDRGRRKGLARHIGAGSAPRRRRFEAREEKWVEDFRGSIRAETLRVGGEGRKRGGDSFEKGRNVSGGEHAKGA